VRARRVHVAKLLQDLVALVHVALVELVVGLDRGTGDAVELVELRLELSRGDLLELERKRGHGRPAEHILAVQAIKELPMAFEVPPLPYDYSALEPHIDEQTMRVHHDKHHQAYVDNANKALEGTQWADQSVEAILGNIEILPGDKQTPVRNNAGGHANHSLFWEIMSPDGGGEPS